MTCTWRAPQDSGRVGEVVGERMTEHVWHWTTSESFPSRLGVHQEFLQSLLERLEALDWPPRDVFGIHMAMEESLTNAVRHGNNLDESKHVRVDCKLSAERFWVRIEDEGEGFCPNDVPDPTAPENLETPGGRGLMLIEAYMTHVEYNDLGNCLTMEKER